MANAVLLDFDGVVTDSEPTIARICRDAAAQWSPAPVAWPNVAGSHLGYPGLLRDHLAALLPAGRVEQIMAEAFHACLEAVLARGPRPGTVALLAAAAQEGSHVAIVSNAGRRWMSPLIDAWGLAPLVDRVWPALESGPPKPDPAGYLSARRFAGVAGGRCFAVEDSPPGITAAKRAGMSCTALVTSQFAPAELGAADRVVRDTELLATWSDWMHS